MLPTDKYLPGIVLFFISAVFGLFIFQDYGVGWDEPIHREMGLVSYKYVFWDDPALNNYIERDHGVGFELPLIMVEKALGLKEYRDILMMRHLVTHLFFLFSAFCGYVLSLKLFRSQMAAVVCFAMLVLHPRIYAHSFLNTKDLPFLSMHLVSFTVAFFAFSRQRTSLYLLLGITCGYTTSIRIMGILLSGVIAFFLLLDIIKSLANRDNMRTTLTRLVPFVAGFCGMVYFSWPALWEHPVQSFIDCYRSLAHFRWQGLVLFCGELMPGTSIPWSYLPVWFSITTPLVWLLAGAAGLLTLPVLIVREPLHYLFDPKDRQFVIYWICCVIPVVAVIALDAVVYDDWRHVYFIYPSFVLLAGFGISRVKRRKWRIVLYGLICVQALAMLVFVVSNHPFQQVYFNHLVPRRNEHLRKNFDREYWGTSFRQGLEYILANDTSQQIKIAWSIDPLLFNIDFLKEQDRKRLQMSSIKSRPVYYLTNFREHPQDFTEFEGTSSIFYEIRVQENVIMRVYRLE